LGRDALTAGRVSKALLDDYGPNRDKPLGVLIKGTIYPVIQITQINGKYVLVVEK
jgi:hypothetical protein